MSSKGIIPSHLALKPFSRQDQLAKIELVENSILLARAGEPAESSVRASQTDFDFMPGVQLRESAHSGAEQAIKEESILSKMVSETGLNGQRARAGDRFCNKEQRNKIIEADSIKKLFGASSTAGNTSYPPQDQAIGHHLSILKKNLDKECSDVSR